MQKFNTFYFEKFEFDFTSLKAKFFYSFDEIEFFEEEIDFKDSDFVLRENIDEEIIINLLFHAHISIWISYYKLFPTKNLVVKSWFLDEENINFWKKFYRNGLWEFFIKNDFNFNDILDFQNSLEKEKKFPLIRGLGGSSLLMWWWWKDSIVSSILLEEEGQNFDAFVFGKIDRIKQNTLEVLWKKTMLVKRKISENLFELNKKWYYNWHVPITWIIAFISLISAYLYNYKNIVLSNESSADEPNIVWQGLKINHQYSKSAEFENDFRKYVEKNIWDINYYSKLRNLWELEIAEIFSKKAHKYFETFSSCNRNFIITPPLTPPSKGGEQEKSLPLQGGDLEGVNWCCNCEKCAFVYLILSANLEEKEMIKIFGQNLFENKNLEETYAWLLGLTKNKPFECVGTYDESRISFKKVLEKYEKNSWENKKIPYILEKFKKEIK